MILMGKTNNCVQLIDKLHAFINTPRFHNRPFFGFSGCGYQYLCEKASCFENISQTLKFWISFKLPNLDITSAQFAI